MRGTTYPVCRSIMTTASYMKAEGHDVLVFDRCIDFRKPEKVFKSFRPELVMIYIPPTATLSEAIEMSFFAKESGIVVVWGEVIAASLADQAVEKGVADFVITGETEYKLDMLIKELRGCGNFRNIPGLSFSENGTVVTNKNQNNTPLDSIPEIDWEMIDVEKCFRRFPHCKKMLYMYTSRGCPYKCAYCYNTMFYNSEHRKRPIRFVLNEICHLERNHGLDGVNFSDELLLLSDEEIEEISRFRKENNLKFVWGGETRADTYRDKESLKKMYDAGCRWFMLGLETGSEQTRKTINKPMNKELIKNFVDECTGVGITTFGSFIIGFPGETSTQLKETVDFALSLNLDAFLFNYFCLIPKTPLSEQVIKEKNIDVSKMISKEFTVKQIQNLLKNYSEISDRDLKVVKSWFDWITFTRKKAEAVQKNMFAKKSFDTLWHFANGGIKKASRNILSAANTFIMVLVYSFCFPKIKKKYGLYNINKK